MLRPALVLLTAIAVLWHATAGCCAHHQHAAAAATEANSCGCHSHGCREEAAERSDASDPAEHEQGLVAGIRVQRPQDSSHDDCGERCSFPQSEGSGVALLKHSLAACDLSLPVATLREAPCLPPGECMEAFDAPPPPHVGHALRRHLALGVLLV
ncbi:MAG TPA: hypothetical protein VGN57_23240 [Pirellulaceae bacterium]|jgi:hypothetical protein|nr:hypothetical protein [Pirellulaceae bacterium]